MVVSCCAFGCHERHVTGGPVTFHTFPKDPVKCNIWVAATQRKDFKPNKFTKICSKHFTDDCFDTQKFGGSWLKSTAFPTIFPSHTIKIDDIVLKPSLRTSATTSSTAGESSSVREVVFARYLKPVVTEVKSPPPIKQPLPKRKPYRYVGDFKDTEALPPELLQHRWNVAKKQIQKQFNLIKLLRRQKRRLRDGNTSMKKLIERVRKKYSLTNDDMRILKETDGTFLSDVSDSDVVKQGNVSTSANVISLVPAENLDYTTTSVNTDEFIIPDKLPIIVGVSSAAYKSNENNHASRKTKLLKRPLSTVVDSRDDSSVFGEFVASKLRNLRDEKSQLLAQESITNILTEMEMEQLKEKTMPNHANFNQSSTSPCIILPTPSNKTTTVPLITMVRPATPEVTSCVNDM